MPFVLPKMEICLLPLSRTENTAAGLQIGTSFFPTKLTAVTLCPTILTIEDAHLEVNYDQSQSLRIRS